MKLKNPVVVRARYVNHRRSYIMQRIIIGLTLVIIAVMCLYPPFSQKYSEIKYAPIWEGDTSIDMTRLAIQCMAVFFGGCGLAYLFRAQADSKKPFILFLVLFIISAVYGVLCTSALLFESNKAEERFTLLLKFARENEQLRNQLTQSAQKQQPSQVLRPSEPVRLDSLMDVDIDTIPFMPARRPSIRTEQEMFKAVEVNHQIFTNGRTDKR
jgi:hypothetical protein